MRNGKVYVININDSCCKSYKPVNQDKLVNLIIELIIEPIVEPIVNENVFSKLDEREKTQDVNETTILHENLIGCCSSYTWLKC